MKNIMYFRLKIGEEATPLRDMALKHFPNANLSETDIMADNYGKKDVLRHAFENIIDGKYDKLYIKDFEVISRKYTEIYAALSKIAKARPYFEIELNEGTVVRAKSVVSIFNTMVRDLHEQRRRDIEMGISKSEVYTDYLKVKIECGEKQAIVELPLAEEYIEQELKKANINLDNDSDVKYTVDTSLPEKFATIIDRACKDKGIYIASEISSALLTYGMELEEDIMAVIEYTDANTTDKVMRIMYDIDGFKFIEGAKSLEDIGRYWVTEDMESSIEEEIDKYMDYTALGRDIMKDYEGKFVEGGCVLNRGEVDIEQLFTMNEDVEEGMGGMQGM